ncbi:MAG: hypothetical protein QM759_17215 [Terricaulis sp.]
MSWGVNEWVAVISAALALVSLVLNYFVVNRQTSLQAETLKMEMDSEVFSWVHEAIDAVSEAISLADGRGKIYDAEEFRTRAFETGHKLSSIADRGRLLFPNEAPDTHGQQKEGAFQGYRQPILDAVVFACGQLARLDPEGGPDQDAERVLTRCRRLLVSEAQNALDPRRREQMLRQLAIGRSDDMRSSFALAAELGNLIEARYPGFLIDKRDAEWVKARDEMVRARQRRLKR